MFIKRSKIEKMPVIFLIFSNLIPLLGVFFLHWDLFSILFLYWLENIVVGIYTLLRIWRAELPAKVPIVFKKPSGVIEVYKASAYMKFFLLHYGIFTVVHGVFILQLFFKPFFFGQTFNPSFDTIKWVLPAFIGLFISHGISHFKNFIGNKEYLKTSPDVEMGRPYKRVAIMHLTVMAGGFYILNLGEPIGALITLVFLKIVVDLFSHLYEHKKTIHTGGRG